MSDTHRGEENLSFCQRKEEGGGKMKNQQKKVQERLMWCETIRPCASVVRIQAMWVLLPGRQSFSSKSLLRFAVEVSSSLTTSGIKPYSLLLCLRAFSSARKLTLLQVVVTGCVALMPQG